MKLWIDAQLNPNLARWITDNLKIEAFSLKYLGLRDASDKVIFEKAKEANAIVLTKDDDFVKLLDLYGSPPKVIWIKCGNTSNEEIKKILISQLPKAANQLENSDLVEII
jgi:predicted nuclease of predicted toxin-antitoxin system